MTDKLLVEREPSVPNTTSTFVYSVIGIPRAERPYMTPPMKSLLSLIRQGESPRHGYNSDYRDDDKWVLIDKTFNEVRALGRSQVKPQGEASSALGAYQFLTKTLDSLKASLVLKGSEIFSEQFQDDLAVALMIRRGLLDFMRKTITAETFANNLAKEWASMPVVTTVKGQIRTVQPGQSYYAGDGLNKASHNPATVLSFIRPLLDDNWLDAPTPVVPVPVPHDEASPAPVEPPTRPSAPVVPVPAVRSTSSWLRWTIAGLGLLAVALAAIWLFIL